MRTSVDRNKDMGVRHRELEKIFRIKYGDASTTGWGPRMRLWFKYFTPDDFYEAMVENLVGKGCAWIDVGCGRDIFPSNRALANILAKRCGFLVGVDPSDNLDENPYVHQRIKTPIESFRSERVFDLATFRMVVEHITRPPLVMDSLKNLIRPGGKVVIYTVDRWSPSSIFSFLVPFRFHHFIKKILWRTKEDDTFPVAYLMNTRKCLTRLFDLAGFKECSLIDVADCRIFGNNRFLSFLSLSLWRVLKTMGIKYPENCLIAVYERVC